MRQEDTSVDGAEGCIPQSNQDDIKEKVVDICSTVVGDNHTRIKDDIDWAATTINR